MDNNVLKYLEEKDEEFFPKEIKNIIEESEDYDDEILFDQIKVKKIPDNSDQVLNADEFMKSNTELQTYYANGSGIDFVDDQGLYEVVKLVKDLTDKHLFIRNVVWKVDIAHRMAVFTFKLGDKDSKSSDDFFLAGVERYLISELWKKYGPLYKIEAEFLKDDEDNIMRLTVIKDDNEDIRSLEEIPAKVRDSASFGDQSSISKM